MQLFEVPKWVAGTCHKATSQQYEANREAIAFRRVCCPGMRRWRRTLDTFKRKNARKMSLKCIVVGVTFAPVSIDSYKQFCARVGGVSTPHSV